jgi:hypothetical protein
MTRITSRQLAAAKKNNGKFVASEADTHYQVIQWLKLKWPRVLFHTDSAGELVFHSQRQRHAKLNHEGIAWPDLQILEARGGWFGLLVEMKKEDENLFSSAGIFKNEHLTRQNHTLTYLNQRNYKAVFAKGFTEITAVIDEYLSAPPTKFKKAKTK